MAKDSELRIMGEGTTTVRNKAVTTRWRHMHRVGVDFGEERCGNSDGWRDKDIVGLTELAKVTSADKPNDVAG